MAVSKRLRMEILRRDNHTCRYCGASAPDVKLTIDHVVPVTLGGQDVPENLVAACVDCNAGKSSVPADASVVQDVSQDALRWADAIEQAAAMSVAARKSEYQRLDKFDELWLDLLPTYNNRGRWRPPDWEDTFNNFLAAGLPEVEIHDAIYVTARKYGLSDRDYWRYFCGVCWRKIDKLREVAKSLLTVEEAGE